MTDAERAPQEDIAETPPAVERSAAAAASATLWKARARVAAPFIVALLAAVALTSASILVERHGPQLIITGENCGASRKDFCFARRLKGGFPIAYLYDSAIVSAPGSLTLRDDDLKKGAFLLDVAIYMAAMLLARVALARYRAGPRRAPERIAVSADTPTQIMPRERKPTPREQPVLARSKRKSHRVSDVSVLPPPSAPIVIASADRELATRAILAELEFTRSLVRTYREYQMQAVRFTVALYAATLGLMALAIDPGKLRETASYCTALLPILTAVLVLVFAVMEVRIRRASRHNQHSISPKLEAMREPGSTPPLLEWEAAPGRWLAPFERPIASSGLLAIAMSLPALGGTAWHLFAGELPNRIWHPVAAGVTGGALLVTTLLAAWLSRSGAPAERSPSAIEG